jgi:ribokinase
MAQPAHVCVVGSANMDLTVYVPRLPRLGETLAGKQVHLGFGGKGANQAVMAARLGAKVTFVARVGNDVFGEHTLANLRSQGIDTAHVRVDPEQATGTAAITVDDDAQNCIIVVPGANGKLSPDDIRQSRDAIQAADAILCQLEVPLETILAAFRLAKAAGVLTILNPAPAKPLPDELLTLADLCVPNETELEHLTERKLASLADIEGAGQLLRKRGAKTVIVTLGDRGALLILDQAAEHIPAHPVVAVDPTGAGDAFIGSLAVFFLEGMSLTEALAKANQVAAMSVTRKGTQTAFPTRAEIPEIVV